MDDRKKTYREHQVRLMLSVAATLCRNLQYQLSPGKLSHWVGRVHRGHLEYLSLCLRCSMPEAKLKGFWTCFLVLCDFQMLNTFQTERPKFSLYTGSCKCHSQPLSQIASMFQGFFELRSYGWALVLLFWFKLGIRWTRYVISNSGYVPCWSP